MYDVRITWDLDTDASGHAVSRVWLPIPQIVLCSALQELPEHLAVPRTRPHEMCPDQSRPFPRIAHFWAQWESSRSFPCQRRAISASMAAHVRSALSAKRRKERSPPLRKTYTKFVLDLKNCADPWSCSQCSRICSAIRLCHCVSTVLSTLSMVLNFIIRHVLLFFLMMADFPSTCL